MNRKSRSTKARKENKLDSEPFFDGGRVEKDEHEDEIKKAIEESMRRFLENNRDNILKSGKERIASASYCGGMFDMIMLIRSALGRWAVEELLTELAKWNRTSSAGNGAQVRINVTGAETGGISQEDAKELGEQIAKWIDERKGHGKRECKDPMFA